MNLAARHAAYTEAIEPVLGAPQRSFSRRDANAVSGWVYLIQLLGYSLVLIGLRMPRTVTCSAIASVSRNFVRIPGTGF